MDMLKSMQQEMQRRNQFDETRAQKDDIRDKAIQSLTNQMGQLATDVENLKKNKGQLPSDTKVNPSHTTTRNVSIHHVNVLGSGKEYKKPFSSDLIEGVVEDITGMENDEEEPMFQNNVLKENTNEKPFAKPVSKENVNQNNKEVDQSQVPFPSALVDPGKKNVISHTSLEKD
ncbi:hypothetical protein QVD17_30643 [Tagetes erecta]|uniref:Uncharacterized protein n=1 Tax=Tagetes erecta TaxID=13708 RepID=A0AAD8K604_TARER|nr:hypothetical protein QVD17_30643 [Tagetes erecta]